MDISKLTTYPTKNEAFHNMSGDCIYNFNGRWACFSDNDPIVEDLTIAGYKTELQIYLEGLKK